MTAAQPQFALADATSPAAVFSQTAIDDLYKHGFAAEKVDQFALAATCFAEVSRRQPSNPFVLLDLARVRFQLLELGEAKTALRTAEQLAGNDIELWYQIGLAYQEGRADTEAICCFQTARRLAPDYSVLTAALAAFYESRGFLKEAEATLAELHAHDSANGLVPAVRGMVQLRKGELAEAISSLATSLEELPTQHPYQINVRYAQAKALATAGEATASLQVLHEAKHRQSVLPTTSEQRATSKLAMEYQTQVRLSLGEVDFREAWRREAEPTNFPLVFLIGYPRSGTTLLEQIIDAHGDVCSLEETGAFLQCTRQVLTGQAPNSDFWRGINAPDAVLREQARQWYCEYLSRLGVSMNRPQVVIDKNPGLIGHVQFISRIFPHAKFLFLIRDPRDVALSAYQTPVSLTPFSVNWLNWDDTVRHCVHHLDHWVTLRNRLPNPHLEVRYEDLIADLTTTGERVMNFLGLDWRPSQARFAEHAQEKQVYSPTLYEVRKDLSPAAKGKWRQFGLDYSAGEPRLSALLKSFGYDIDHHHLNSTATSFADQNSATRSGFDAMAFPSPATQYVR